MAEGTNQRLAAEMAFALLMGFGILILLLAAEKRNVFESGITLGLAVAYGLITGFTVNTGEGSTLAERYWNTSKKRVGMGIFAAIFLTVLGYIFPSRAINLFAVFIVFEVLATLLPGKALFYGGELWKQSKVLYALTAAIAFIFLTISLFSLPFSAVVWLFTNVSGVFFMLSMLIVFALMLLGLFGKRAGGAADNRNEHSGH